MKELIKTEFKRNFKSWILWASIIVGLSLLMLSLYPAFSESMNDMVSLLDNMPQGLLEAFGLGEGGLDMTEPYGWFGMEGYLFVVLIGGSYAGILGASILSKEEDDKTIEFLLSKPISRNQILLGKSIVVITNLLLLNLVLFVFLLITFAIIDEIIFLTIVMLCVGPLLLQLVFAAMGMAFSIFIIKSRAVISTTLGMVIGLYFLDIIATLTDKLEFLKYVTPYEYVNAVSIVNDNSIDLIYLILALSIIAVSAFVTWVFYNRKDIAT